MAFTVAGHQSETAAAPVKIAYAYERWLAEWQYEATGDLVQYQAALAAAAATRQTGLADISAVYSCAVQTAPSKGRDQPG